MWNIFCWLFFLPFEIILIIKRKEIIWNVYDIISSNYKNIDILKVWFIFANSLIYKKFIYS